MTTSFRRTLLSASCLVAATLITPDIAWAQNAARTFDIPAQSASSGMRLFAEQAGIEISFADEAAASRSVSAVKGVLDVAPALDRMLIGTGLFVQAFDGKIAVVAAAQDDAATQEEGSIVVTGSRISRPETDSVMPVRVIAFDQMAALGRNNAYEALRREPSISPGISNESSDWQYSTPGLAAINLRQMGTNRSLVLIDGRRRVSGNSTSSEVNLNQIPAAMIDRIEVVTGGAAAIYGADAVTGAVNIVTKTDLEGIELNAYKGISQRGDNPETNLSLAIGGKFADDRGSFAVGATYLKTGTVLQGDRSFSQTRLVYHANLANTGPNDGIPDFLLNRDWVYFYGSENPGFWNSRNSTYYILDNGQLTTPKFDRMTTRSGEFAFGEGSNDPSTRSFAILEPLKLGEETFSTIARFDYEVVDGVTYGARLDFARTVASGMQHRYREDSRKIWALGSVGATAYLDNPFMPSSMRTLLTDAGITSVGINRIYSNWPTIDPRHDRQTITISQDLSGRIGDAVDWSAFYQWGRATQDTTISNMPLASRWFAARDAVADQVTGATVCRDAAARAAGCVPINIFGQEPLTQAQKTWLLYDRHNRRINEQKVMGANVSGKLFRLPAGDVSFALGTEYRRDAVRTTEDPLALSGEATTSVDTVGASPPIKAAMTVKEVYGELVIPVLSDLPFIRRLEIEGAYRYSDYSNFGGTEAWKIGGFWEPTSGIKLRGVVSRSVRVPNFGELYSPIIRSTDVAYNDPCHAGAYNLTPTRATNCAASGISSPLSRDNAHVVNITSGGNPDLRPETADSYTIGLVLQPRFLPRLNLTVDYWDTKIKNVVTSFGHVMMMQLCVDLPSIQNPFCDAVKRGANGQVNQVSSQLINSAAMNARGVDLGIDYSVPLLGGDLGFNFTGTYLIQREYQAIPDANSQIIKYVGRVSDARVRAALLTTYSSGPFSVALDTRVMGSTKVDPTVSDEYYEFNTIPKRIYNDLAISRNFQDRFDIGIGIKNLFDVKPPMMPGANANAGRFDAIGRSFFVRLGAKL